MSGSGTKEKVFEIGLGRTGTNSLTVAMSMLGYRVQHGTTNKLVTDGVKRFLWDGTIPGAAIEKWDFFSNWPDVMWRELSHNYPESRFILTWRSPLDWAGSYAKHDRTMAGKQRRAVQQEKLDVRVTRRLAQYGIARYSHERYVAKFIRHRTEIEQWFIDEPKRLLMVDICNGDGWDKLCDFLQIEQPCVPFPRANDVATQKRLRAL